MTDWDEVRIEDLGDIIAGGTPSRGNPSYWNGRIPWVTPSEITELRDKYLRETRERITGEGLAGSAAKLLPPGSVLVTTRATLGEAAIAAVPVATNQGFKSIIPNADSHSLFTYYLIRSLKSEMDRLASGTTFLEISKADFSRIKVRRPKHDEQTRIAAMVDTVDKAIAKTKAVIAKLRRVRAGLLHDLLTRGLDEHGQLRNPIAMPQQFCESVAGLIPRSWSMRPIKECLISQPQNGLYKPARQVGHGVLLIGQTCITGDRTLELSEARRVELSLPELERFALQENDILISRVFATLAGIGLPAIVPALAEPAAYESNMMRLRVDTAIIIPRLMFEMLRTQRVRASIVAAAQLSNQASINQSGLNSIPICVPPPEEQRAIVTRIAAADEFIKASESELAKFEHVKLGLMADLLTGRVHVPESLVAVENQL